MPTWAIATTTIIACLLALVNIGSSVAFNDIISLSVSCLYLSYLICCVLFLYRRIRGAILLPSEASGATIINTAGAQLVWGPFRVPGLLGISVNVLTVAYLILVIFFSFWPPLTPVTGRQQSITPALICAGALLALQTYLFLMSTRSSKLLFS